MQTLPFPPTFTRCRHLSSFFLIRHLNSDTLLIENSVQGEASALFVPSSTMPQKISIPSLWKGFCLRSPDCSPLKALTYISITFSVLWCPSVPEEIPVPSMGEYGPYYLKLHTALSQRQWSNNYS